MLCDFSQYRLHVDSQSSSVQSYEGDVNSTEALNTAYHKPPKTSGSKTCVHDLLRDTSFYGEGTFVNLTAIVVSVMPL